MHRMTIFVPSGTSLETRARRPEVVSPQTPAFVTWTFRASRAQHPLKHGWPHLIFGDVTANSTRAACYDLCRHKTGRSKQGVHDDEQENAQTTDLDPPLISAEPGSVSDYQIERLISL